MYRLTIKEDIAAAHFLRNYDGPCADLHGHTYIIEITVEGATLNEAGLLVDFKDLKGTLREILAEADHKCLNDLPAFKDLNPSAENIARWVFEEFQARYQGPDVRLARVCVRESENAWADYIG